MSGRGEGEGDGRGRSPQELIGTLGDRERAKDRNQWLSKWGVGCDQASCILGCLCCVFSVKCMWHVKCCIHCCVLCVVYVVLCVVVRCCML